MGFLMGRSIFIEGLFARVMYRSLPALHERALHGLPWTVLALLTRSLPDALGRS
jgi:NADH dehydrogenase